MSNVSDSSINGLESQDSTNTKILRAIADVFQTAQSTYAGHRRHIAVLKRIQAKAVQKGYEEIFNYWFNKMVTLVLPLKRTEIVGDRIVRLVAGFVASLENDLETQKESREEHSKQDEVFSRFVNQFVRHILRGIESRDKNVRYRVTQLLAVIMDNIGEIDEDLYNLIMWSFQKRVYDKEPFVRIQSIFCLTKFQDEESTSDTVDDATGKLMHAIQNDPSAEVRRAAMLNLVSTDRTQELIMERARDVNPINRRIVYSRVLKNMGASVFQKLDIAVIGKLITYGLEDREENVRNACSRLVALDWLNIMNGDIIKLLVELDVTRNTVCAKVMDAIFSYRDDTVSKIKLPEDIWQDLTAEVSFLIKAFHSHCLQYKLDDVVDANFPEASKLSAYLQKYLDTRFTKVDLSAHDVHCLEFIIEQVLTVAVRYDYSDEVGRRAMLIVIRNSLAKHQLSPTLVKTSLKVLEVLSINERDFIAMTVEIITDIRDEDIEKQEIQETNKKSLAVEAQDEQDDEEMESFHSAVDDLVNGNTVPDQGARLLATEREASSKALIACLTMSQCMLELVLSPIEDNIMVTSLIETLITPAVRNTQAEVRELGVRNLGLCCLMDVKLATESLYLFGMCVSKGDASLKNIALQVIFDIFSIHGLKVVDGEGKVDSISLHKIFYKTLKNCKIPECQAIVAEGLCKLFLGDVFTDDDLFETLVLSYFSPANSQNEALVQAFAFCLPVYCFSHIQHQKRMVRVAGDVLLRLSVLWDEVQTNTDDTIVTPTMLKPSLIFQELIDWTDPNKVVNQTENINETEDSQLDFLVAVLKMYYKLERKDVKKMILTNINRFGFNGSDMAKWKEASEVLEDILDNDDIDSSSRNSITKFLASLTDFMKTRGDQEKHHSDDEIDDRFSSDNGSTTHHEPAQGTSRAVSQDLLKDAALVPEQEANTAMPEEIGLTLETSGTSGTSEILPNRKRKRSENTASEFNSDLEKSSRLVSFILPDDNAAGQDDSSIYTQSEDADYDDNNERNEYA
ncbi:LADA_0F11430g1_1 [Lachancea dasiensis]|uniref:LADA_0F11430g1_1 n=1 Tax=Lachancea dasiensis TaxID=1072105 RepID=A0A1G4JMA7_9SACH|nr:LADA_0F11430g1_1 [Lachancea dasiensis]